MRKIGLMFAGLLTAGIVVVGPAGPVAAAAATPDNTFADVVPGITKQWDGRVATGLGPREIYQCGKDVRTMCESILVELENPLTAGEIEQGITSKLATATIGIAPVANSDFDIYLYTSDAAGTQGDLLDASERYLWEPESVSVKTTTTVERPSVYVLLHVMYWTVVESNYKGTLTYEAGPAA